MEIEATLRYHRTAPRKVRLVAGLVRGKKVNDALAQLSFLEKKTAPVVAKLLRSAVSNAKNNFKIKDEETLYIKRISVDEGPMLKRHMPKARGSADLIRKKTSHIKIVLAEQQEKKKKELTTKSKKDNE